MAHWMLACGVLGLALCTLAWAQGDAGADLQMVEFTPQLTDEVLHNPGMGLYHQHPPLDLPEDHWLAQIADIAYYRLDWSRLNPEPGVYLFDDYFGPIFDAWVTKRGRRVAFRVMCESMHSRTKYVTPKWVFDWGVPGVDHVGIYGQEQVDPAFWDYRYLDLQCEFIQKLGEYLDGAEGLEFVDIGSIGEWGEMHLGLFMPGRWTQKQLEETGFTEAKYVMAYRQIIDAFARAFPHTPIFLNVGGRNYQTINDYAALRGMHFRQDGLSPSGASADVGSWLYGPYSRRGVVCNFEFHSGYQEMQQKGWDLAATISKGLEAPISYLNTNLGCYGKVAEELPRELTRAARKIGYRFVLTSVQHLPQIRLYGDRPSRVPLVGKWRNDGVAPCYESLAVEWSLVNAAGETVASGLSFPPNPTSQWWPGEEQTDACLLRLPAGSPAGEYTVRVRMLNPETEQTVQLGIAGRDAENGYPLFPLAAIPAEHQQAVVYIEGFETPEHRWSGVQGMTETVDTGDAHSGKASLLVRGLNEKGWNYAGFTVPAPPIPCARYRFTLWAKVESIDPQTSAPYAKIGVNNRAGHWVENYNSDKYDLKRLGEWQELEVLADLPADVGSLHLAVEKGAFDTPIRLTMRIDDAKLELVEAP